MGSIGEATIEPIPPGRINLGGDEAETRGRKFIPRDAWCLEVVLPGAAVETGLIAKARSKPIEFQAETQILKGIASDGFDRIGDDRTHFSDRAPRAWRFSRDQYESALMTSPPLIEPSAIQVAPLMVSFMNRTAPSPIRTLTPPG